MHDAEGRDAATRRPLALGVVVVVVVVVVLKGKFLQDVIGGWLGRGSDVVAVVTVLNNSINNSVVFVEFVIVVTDTKCR